MSDHGSLFVGLFGVFLILFIVLLALAAFVFWLWMLIDALKSKHLSDNEKLVWVLVLVFTHFLGAAIYFFVGRKR